MNYDPIFDKNQKLNGRIEPIVHCPICKERVYAEHCDNGFGQYSTQIEPYHCECGWVEVGCIVDECIKDRCRSWDICRKNIKLCRDCQLCGGMSSCSDCAELHI